MLPILVKYILWEDIRQQFGDVQYVMNDGVMIPFMRDANCEEIETQREVILEVVLQESKQDADDDASSMPDLELLSIADPDLQRKLEDIRLGGTSNAQKGSKNAQEAIEVKALYYLTRQMKDYKAKITEAKLLQGEPLHMLSTLALSDNFEMQRTAAHCYSAISREVRLLQIKDDDLQGVAAGALSNISGCEELVEDVVNSGAVPFLIGLLDSSKEPEMQQLCAKVIWNISFNDIGREQLLKSNTKLVTALMKLTSSTNALLQLAATEILSFLCMEQSFQIELIKEGGIPPLLRLLESDDQLAVRLPMFCLYTIFRDSQDRTIFAKPKIIKLLIDLTRFKDEDEMDPANLAIFMLLCLVKHREYHKMIVDAGVFERFYSSVSNVSEKIQIQMTSLIYQLRSACKFFWPCIIVRAARYLA
ncbi:Vacuolar protein 8 [Dissophora globulifera]|nr:Vacuolar protein 8 [Dissophora globulifera]